jgi:hypothetical protein
LTAPLPAGQTSTVRIPRTAEFDQECATYGLQFCCEECAHFEKATEGCRHGWPVEFHRRSHSNARPFEIVFCKEFDLC